MAYLDATQSAVGSVDDAFLPLGTAATGVACGGKALGGRLDSPAASAAAPIAE